MRSLPRRRSRSDSVGVLNDEQIKGSMAWRKTLEKVGTFHNIKKPEVLKRIAEMVKSIATTLADE